MLGVPVSLMAPKFRDRAACGPWEQDWCVVGKEETSHSREGQVTAKRHNLQQKRTSEQKGRSHQQKGTCHQQRQITAERDMPPPDRDISWPAVALPTVPAVKNAATIPRKVPIGSAPAIHAIRGRIKAGKAEAGRDKQFPTQLWLKPVLQETHGP